MSQPEKTGILYDQIIAKVIEDSRERFEAEGADMAVLSELQKVSSSVNVHHGRVVQFALCLYTLPTSAQALRVHSGCLLKIWLHVCSVPQVSLCSLADIGDLWPLEQLWWEKLQQYGIVGSVRGSGGVGGAGGYHHHVQARAEDQGMQFPSGAPPARMAPSHGGSDAYGKVNIKNELPQTDGADNLDDLGDAGVAASRPGRRPRRGDYVEVEVCMGEGGAGSAGSAVSLNVEQLDGAGSGPRKRKHEDDDDGKGHRAVFSQCSM